MQQTYKQQQQDSTYRLNSFIDTETNYARAIHTHEIVLCGMFGCRVVYTLCFPTVKFALWSRQVAAKSTQWVNVTLEWLKSAIRKLASIYACVCLVWLVSALNWLSVAGDDYCE